MSAKRDEYIEKMKQQLDEWNSEITKLEARGEEAKGAAQERYNTQVNELREKLRSAQDKMKELQYSGQDTWEEFKVQLDDLRDAFVHSFNYFKSQL